MYCPYCHGDDTRVIDSRVNAEAGAVRRRRECADCGSRFTTYERPEVGLPRVVKQDGTRVPFDDDKLRAGMLRALEKRPVAADAIDDAVAQIRRYFMDAGEKEVASRIIGEHVMRALRELDEIAYVRFASVYHRFERVEEFQDTVAAIQSEPTPEARRSQLSLLPSVADVSPTGDQAREPKPATAKQGSRS